jgi:hypothetical protein
MKYSGIAIFLETWTGLCKPQLNLIINYNLLEMYMKLIYTWDLIDLCATQSWPHTCYSIELNLL